MSEPKINVLEKKIPQLEERIGSLEKEKHHHDPPT